MSTSRNDSRQIMRAVGQIDSAMMEALRNADVPAYLVNDLFESGRLARVYQALEEQRTLLNRGLTTDETTALVNKVIGEIGAEDLRRSRADKEAKEESKGEPFFPTLQDERTFPSPVELEDPYPARETLGPVMALKPQRLRAKSTLLRVEMVLTKWRKGSIGDDEALESIQEMLGETIPADPQESEQ